MLQPVKDMDEFKRIKEALRNKFEAERTGEQHLFVEQSKLLQPLIEPLIATQQHTVNAIRDTAIMGEPVARRSLGSPPLGEHLDVDTASAHRASGDERSECRTPSVPAARSEARVERARRAASPAAPLVKIDLDSGLNDIDIQNLQDMNFELPSEVFENQQIEETLNKIKTENRSIGQKLGKGSDATDKEKEIYRSWKETLSTYKQKIQGLEGAKQFVGKGVDVIFYPSIDDLCMKLAEFDAAKQAGNTGLDNRINSVLDELLRTQAISKDVYDDLYKIIFL
jgi:hypothetical protein